MPHTLQRLFTFAKATGACPLENFTTEALAAAIRSDGTPFLQVLGRADRTVQKVTTQVQVRGGVVDLELVLDDGTVFWIEVKAHAGESGDQVERYRAAAKRDHRNPSLVMLCKRPLRSDVPTLRWNHLRDAISSNAHLRWIDLKHFIEDNAMADDFDAPITPHEMAAAMAAHTLLAKVARLARELFESSPHVQTIDFPRTAPNIARAIAQQFRDHRRCVVASRSYPTILFGLLPKDVGAEIAVWVEFRPTDFDRREEVFAVAEGGGLSDAWTRRREGWSRLLATRKLEGELAQDSAIKWLCERFEDLDESGVLQAIARNAEVNEEHDRG
jgi:hypothetical protein